MKSYRETAFYRYHCETKHSETRLRADTWYMDWDNQPNPFRHYQHVPIISLPAPERPAKQDYFALRDVSGSRSVTVQSVAQLLYYSMAISAWKEIPSQDIRWALRVNPSSGNLHPTETHIIASGVEGLPDGCYHFRVDEFQLEGRFQGRVDGLLSQLSSHCGLPCRALTLVLTSIFWREAWKYRARAFRYCHHDVGHAVGSIVEAARGLGLSCALRHGFDDVTIARMLGLEATDEAPCALLSIGTDVSAAFSFNTASLDYRGTPNALSLNSIEFPAITRVYAATKSRPTPAHSSGITNEAPAERDRVISTGGDSKCDFWDVVRRRRSGVQFDGQTGVDQGELGAILQRANVSADSDILSISATAGGAGLIQLYLYVHLVKGIEQGLYRFDARRNSLQLMRTGDQRHMAAFLSLGQSIAGQSAFAVSMIADLQCAYMCFGERGYRAAHIEAGLVGQALYLGAESVGTNATGIGAFFDDDVNQYLKLPAGREVIYHFTVGRAVVDRRLRTQPAYEFESAHAVDTAAKSPGSCNVES